jgi:hypothetical protein
MMQIKNNYLLKFIQTWYVNTDVIFYIVKTIKWAFSADEEKSAYGSRFTLYSICKNSQFIEAFYRMRSFILTCMIFLLNNGVFGTKNKFISTHWTLWLALGEYLLHISNQCKPRLGAAHPWCLIMGYTVRYSVNGSLNFSLKNESFIQVVFACVDLWYLARQGFICQPYLCNNRKNIVVLL